MGTEHTQDEADSTERRTALSTKWSGESGTPEIHEFTKLQQETDEIGITGILKDPEYLDFLESFGEFEMPDDDEMALAELVNLEPNETEQGETSPKGAPAKLQQPEDTRSDVVDALIDALENDAVSEAQRAEFRDALGLQERKRMEVQFNHLKSRFLDLEAYIRAMEAFFEEDTNPLDEIEEIQKILSTIQDEVETLTEQLETTEQELTAFASHQAEHDKELVSLEQSVEQIRTSLRQNLSVIETELKRNNRWRKRVSDAFQDEGSEHEDGDPAETHSNQK